VIALAELHSKACRARERRRKRGAFLLSDTPDAASPFACVRNHRPTDAVQHTWCRSRSPPIHMSFVEESLRSSHQGAQSHPMLLLLTFAATQGSRAQCAWMAHPSLAGCVGVLCCLRTASRAFVFGRCGVSSAQELNIHLPEKSPSHVHGHAALTRQASGVLSPVLKMELWGKNPWCMYQVRITCPWPVIT
jgi:hypothetical protein